jgi:surface protein
LELEYLDVSNWNVSKVETFERFLAGYDAFNGVDVNVYKMKIANLDLSKWVTSSAYGRSTEPTKAFFGMFSGCANLTKLDLRGFAPAPGKTITLSYMFTHCTNLVEVNLSGLSSAKVQDANQTFYKCSNLKTVYVGDGWQGNLPGSSTDLFAGCTSLVGGAGTVFNPAKINKEYARIDVPAIGDTPAVPGYFTHIKDKPADPEQN